MCVTRWWVDLGWMPGAHQAALSLPFHIWTAERKYNKGLLGWDKDREVTQQLLSWPKQTQLGEISLIYYESNQSMVTRKKKTTNLKTSFPHPSLLPRLSFTPIFSTSSLWVTQGGQGMGTAVSSSHVVCCFFLLALLCCSSMGSLPGRQSSMDFSTISPSHGLQSFTKCSSTGPFHKV